MNTLIMITINYSMDVEGKVMRLGRMLFIFLVIVVTSWLVYSVNVRTL